ncbi:UDP-N-acetylglucosamine--N-acetylmuramyl-(pentapeptide) pyrophosphoryl-undecaprenol N-acetylglucosamine transferase [Sideroxyarcus emersonii]|uniref:UDP-N-acetylglucosamine--N-acetylmuramyl-(pentapeptide) pyrophosphoryl-undecaprenol N-acetylglucosamine transferase n=1 Tax=Sideroxyarcus emersonii TaxID=2764705 RepID=A0AAN1XCM7_9PROT|nr:undecaprenyldiphospho-muramoylpentapeptide beta-N-acetylglucosaminyltransferase [Sideroxyarcus emersonii]BCK88682.1 UDP-N-acetylglucosamine--N-acetylmuramyl-(pentapeptide) pyrophosphoryl-undecaprenol N-acetylglucosamine transferase [Sideroxyarcus emersonii]
MSRTILIMAGGTGGHIYPGLAVADALRVQGWQVVWLGAPNSMEAELVPRHGYPVAWVNFTGVRGKGVMRLLTLPFTLLRALGQSAAAIFTHRPDVVLGMGGYITMPGGLMAAMLRRPLVIHEQNSIAGMSNKLLVKIATRVLSGFPDVLKGTQWCGNPVRADIASLPEPETRYAGRSGKLNMLVVGGSLGAQALNEALPKALAMLDEQERPNVLHQTGKKHFENVQQLYRQAGVNADIRPFLDDMASQYGRADVVICRAGALTIAELAAAGVASVLVPFPFAVDDHQTHNARFLSEKNAALLLPQKELSAEKLAQLLREMTREKLLAMAQAARSLAKPEATAAVAAVCTEMAEAS